MAAVDPILDGDTVDNVTGKLFAFTVLVSEVVASVRGNSAAGSICYVAPDAIPAASVGSGRVGIPENGSRAITGAMTGFGARMDSGTAIIEITAYQVLQQDQEVD